MPGSLRTKFVAGCSVAEQYALGAVKGRADALAKNTAFVASPLIAFESSAELKKALDLLQADTDFFYAEIRDAEGRVLASSGRSATRPETYTAKASVTDNGKIWGSVSLALSLARMR